MNKVQWVIEHGVFPEEWYDKVRNTFSEVDATLKVTSEVEKYVDEFLDSPATFGSYCIPYGSVGTTLKLWNKTGGNPLEHNLGIWYNQKALSWGNLSAYWGNYLLNSDHVIISLGSFRERLSYFYRLFGKEVNGQNVLFMKPFENDKSFTGMMLLEVVADGTIDNFINDVNYYDKMSKETLIVVSAPKIVSNEWRFCVCDGEIISSSQYNKKREKDLVEGCSNAEVVEVAKDAIAEWEPDVAYTIDICDSEGKYYVMEAGCINCCDIYKSNQIAFFNGVTNLLKNC